MSEESFISMLNIKPSHFYVLSTDGNCIPLAVPIKFLYVIGCAWKAANPKQEVEKCKDESSSQANTSKCQNKPQSSKKSTNKQGDCNDESWYEENGRQDCQVDSCYFLTKVEVFKPFLVFLADFPGFLTSLSSFSILSRFVNSSNQCVAISHNFVP